MMKGRDRQTTNDTFETAWRSRFEEFASIRDDDAGIAGWSPAGLDARMRRFTGLWRPSREGLRWLDAGCGAGTYTRYLFEVTFLLSEYTFYAAAIAYERFCFYSSHLGKQRKCNSVF